MCSQNLKIHNETPQLNATNGTFTNTTNCEHNNWQVHDYNNTRVVLNMFGPNILITISLYCHSSPAAHLFTAVHSSHAMRAHTEIPHQSPAKKNRHAKYLFLFNK